MAVLEVSGSTLLFITLFHSKTNDGAEGKSTCSDIRNDLRVVVFHSFLTIHTFPESP